jgi:hypothetical protein
VKLSEVRLHYFQTWQWTAPLPRVCKPFFYWLCEHTIGHELSTTEHGWDGSEWADNWCRWCGLKIQTPAVSNKFVQDYKEGKVAPNYGFELTPPPPRE